MKRLSHQTRVELTSFKKESMRDDAFLATRTNKRKSKR